MKYKTRGRAQRPRTAPKCPPWSWGAGSAPPTPPAGNCFSHSLEAAWMCLPRSMLDLIPALLDLLGTDQDWKDCIVLVHLACGRSPTRKRALGGQGLGFAPATPEQCLAQQNDARIAAELTSHRPAFGPGHTINASLSCPHTVPQGLPTHVSDSDVTQHSHCTDEETEAQRGAPAQARAVTGTYVDSSATLFPPMHGAISWPGITRCQTLWWLLGNTEVRLTRCPHQGVDIMWGGGNK